MGTNDARKHRIEIERQKLRWLRDLVEEWYRDSPDGSKLETALLDALTDFTNLNDALGIVSDAMTKMDWERRDAARSRATVER